MTSMMERGRAYDWSIVALTAAALTYLILSRDPGPPLTTFLFWIAVLVAIELLPVTLAFESQVVMSFPIHLAVAMLYPPWAAMTIAVVGAFDPREFRREVSMHRALFNRCQQALSVGVAAAVFAFTRPGLERIDIDLTFAAAVAVATVLATAANLLFVVFHIHFRTGVSTPDALRSLLPRPIAGFWVSYGVLAVLGAAAAVVYARLGDLAPWAIIAFLIPLLFARLAIVGAQAKERLSERLRVQQQALMRATEKIFTERERERSRIAEWVHDSSLQTLAGVKYSCERAQNLVASGELQEADRVLTTARTALEEAIGALRDSFVELRRPLVRPGGLLDSVRDYLDQIETLWHIRVELEADVIEEPPFGVAVGVFQILQESLINAVKHSGTDRITVKMEERDGELSLVVEDRGTGFDAVAAAADDRHLGLGLMKERAAELGGTIELRSEPGRGTRLVAVFPGVSP